MAMTARERFLAVMDFQQPDGFPLTEFLSWWPETITRWSKEGMPHGINYFEHFGFVQMHAVPINFNFLPAYERKVLEETDEYIIVTDECKITKKEFKNSSAMPHFIDFPIKTRKDFLEIKERMNPTDPMRYPQNWNECIEHYKKRDYPLEIIIRGPFAFGRDFMKFNDLMLMFYDDPELMREMMEFQVDFTIKLWEKVLNDVDIDFVYIGEDMAYKNGTMVSPAIVKGFIIPQYKKLTSFLREYGIKNIFLDSDGNIEAILPLIVEAGFTGILPIENVAGMDPEKIREQHPKLRMIGGLDKLKIAGGREGMELEIQKAKRLIDKGGYIPSFDHSVPPILSYNEYKYYIQRLSEEIGG